MNPLDQHRLSLDENGLACGRAEGIAQAIRDMVSHGVPAVSTFATYDMVLVANIRMAVLSERVAALEKNFDLLAASRKTATNPSWELNLMSDLLKINREVNPAMAQLSTEERDGHELLDMHGKRFSADIQALNLVFDMTLADLITVIGTEKGTTEYSDVSKVTRLVDRKILS